MMLKSHYNTVIIGAGPSGLSCALTLLENGITDVLVAEKYKFPRDKCCAGYITYKTKKVYEEYGLDVENCGYTLIKDFRLLLRMQEKQRIENKFLFTGREINRVALDDGFFRLAVSKGIEVCENTSVTDHDPESNTVVFNKNISVSYDHLVFADGTLGFGSRYQYTEAKNIAMQLIFKEDHENRIEIHFGISAHGYGWISSNNGVTNVGLTDVYKKGTDYRVLFADFLKQSGIEADMSGLYAAFTPIGIRKPVIGDNVYFVGDAMGACDPLTLSGLRYGLMSGKFAAQSIAKDDPNILKRYAANLRSRFAITRILQRLFYLKPVQFMVFDVGCRYFGGIIRYFFNKFLTKK